MNAPQQIAMVLKLANDDCWVVSRAGKLPIEERNAKTHEIPLVKFLDAVVLVVAIDHPLGSLPQVCLACIRSG